MEKDISAAIIASMSDGLLVLDPQGNITHINPAALAKLGLSAEETRAMTYSDLFLHEPENDAFNDILFDGIQKREARHYGEVAFKRRDGRILDLAVTTSFLGHPGEGAADQSIVVVFKDITELRDLDRARKRVLAHLSHELRTPLAIVLASIKRLITPQNENAGARIYRNLERLLDLQAEVEDIVKGRPLQQTCSLAPWVDQALDLVELVGEENPAHAEALALIRDKIAADFKLPQSEVRPVSIAESAREALGGVRRQAAGRQVTMETAFREDGLIRMDPAVLHKVLAGIIRNAVENTPDGGRIVVGLEVSRARARLSIEDTGVGITADSLKQIFGGFYHATETVLYTTKRPYDFGAGGKGLDLLRAKIYAEMFGFTIECHSTRCRHVPTEMDLCPGTIVRCPHAHDPESCAASGGSVFVLSFPVIPEPASE